jgi:hypothetical protein
MGIDGNIKGSRRQIIVSGERIRFSNLENRQKSNSDRETVNLT